MVGELVNLLQTRSSYADSLDAKKHAIDLRTQELLLSLYGSFVRPVENDIAGMERLLVVQQPEFALLPLHALRKPITNRYLAEQIAVSYLPSAFALTLPSRVPVPPPSRQTSRIPHIPDIVAIGNPGTTGWDVEYELRDIRAFFKDARFYFGQQATLPALQREHGDLLHMAAEMHFDEHDPGNSYIVLSDGKAFNTTTPILWGEFFSFPSFPAVILSNLGDDRVATHASLPEILLIDGCEHVMTQSYTPQRKTKKYFGEIYYTALLSGATSQQCFHQVQLEMIRNPEYSAPNIWAPFFSWGK